MGGMEHQRDPHPADQANVLGDPLDPCCHEPTTGFLRDGYCTTVGSDQGEHTVCAEMTAEFLHFSQATGNDLSTPQPRFAFPGLRPGDRWCLCVARWLEAVDAGVAPPVILDATNESVLEHTTINTLNQYAIE